MSTKDRSAEEFLVDERHVKDAVQRVRQADRLRDLVRLLGELGGTLEAHFGREEEPDGFFDLIRDRSAVHIGPVEQLRREHVAFMRDVETLAEKARACLAGPVAEIYRQAADLAARLERHEKRESDLLGEAMNRDPGAGG